MAENVVVYLDIIKSIIYFEKDLFFLLIYPSYDILMQYLNGGEDIERFSFEIN